MYYIEITRNLLYYIEITRNLVHHIGITRYALASERREARATALEVKNCIGTCTNIEKDLPTSVIRMNRGKNLLPMPYV